MNNFLAIKNLYVNMCVLHKKCLQYIILQTFNIYFSAHKRRGIELYI